MNKIVNGLLIISISAGMSQSILAADYRVAVGPGDKDVNGLSVAPLIR